MSEARNSIRSGYFVISLLAITLMACDRSDQQSESELPAVNYLESASSNVAVPRMPFTDVSIEAGLDYVHYNNASGERWLPEIMVGGIAFVDFDNDLDPDIFAFSGTHDEESSRTGSSLVVFRNLGNGRFEDVTDDLGINRTDFGFGVTVADFNGDTWPDLYLASHGPNSLLLGKGGEGFTDVSDEMAIKGDPAAISVVSSASDVDGDGDLDIVVGNYVDWSRDRDARIDERFDGIKRAYSHPNIFEGTPANLLINNFPGAFTDASEESGIVGTADKRLEGKVLGVVAVSLGDDQFPDLLVANDSIPNFAFRNMGGGEFEEVGNKLGFAYNNMGKSTAAMGIDAAWLGDDLTLHVAIGNFSGEMSAVYRYDPPGIFTDVAPLTGIGVPSRKVLTFGVLFADLDLDGRQDYVQVNGHVQPDIAELMSSQSFGQSAQVFWNCGHLCQRPFNLLNSNSIGDLGTPLVGRGLAAADYDSDGDLDLLVSSVNGALRLFRNDQTSGHNWLRVALEGDPANSAAFGAVVEIVTEDGRQRRQVKSSSSYVSQSESVLSFGLGDANTVDSLVVRWPDGTTQELNDLAANRLLRISKLNTER